MKIENFENLFREYDRLKNRILGLQLALDFKYQGYFINEMEVAGKIEITERMIITELELIKTEYVSVQRKILDLKE